MRSPSAAWKTSGGQQHSAFDSGRRSSCGKEAVDGALLVNRLQHAPCCNTIVH